VGSRLMGKWLDWRLTEWVNGGGAAIGIRATKRCSEGGTDGRRRGLPRGARSGDEGGKNGPRHEGVVRLLFERGQVRQGGGGVRATWLMRGGSEARAGGGSLPTGERCQLNRGRGERLTSGPRQQCWAAVPLTSGARRAAGEAERGGALTGGTGLSAGVDSGEAATCAGRAWAGPGRKKGGPSGDE
jgi:hypothetical protein